MIRRRTGDSIPRDGVYFFGGRNILLDSSGTRWSSGCPRSPSGTRRNHRMSEALSGAEFKKQLREGQPKLGLFLNSHSPTVAEQLAHSGYDWLLVDTQHGPMGYRESVGDAGRNLQRRREIDGARGRISRPRRHSAVARHGRRRRAGSLHQHRRRSPPGGELRAVSHSRHALGLFPAAQHEQSRAAGLRRRGERQRDRGAAGGDRRLHQEHR